MYLLMSGDGQCPRLFLPRRFLDPHRPVFIANPQSVDVLLFPSPFFLLPTAFWVEMQQPGYKCGNVSSPKVDTHQQVLGLLPRQQHERRFVDELYSCFSSSWARQPFKIRSMFLSSGDNEVHRLNLLRTGESRNSSGFMCEPCTLHPIIHLKVRDWGPSLLCPGSAVIWGACWWNISQSFSSSGYWEGFDGCWQLIGGIFSHVYCQWGFVSTLGIFFLS